MAIDLAKMRAKYAEVKEQQSRRGFAWRPKEGDNKIRILPNPANADEFFVEFKQIWGLGQGAKISPASWGDPCPIAEAVKELWDSSRPEDHQMAKDLRPTTRYAVNIVTQDEPDKAQVFEMPITVFEQILGFILDEDYGDITDPKKGRWINIKRSGTGFDTTYQVIPAGKTTPLAKAKSVLGSAEDLEKRYKEQTMTYDALKALLEGEVAAGESSTVDDGFDDEFDEEIEDEDVEEEELEDEELDEEDEEWDEDEESEEDEDEEWDEEDEEDEDEEDEEEWEEEDEDEESEEDEDEDEWDEEDWDEDED